VSARRFVAFDSSPIAPAAPATFAAGEERGLEDGVALCLSGGGYRAMLFHVGSLWRLNEAAWLPKLRRISSVSGGSITAGVLGLAWARLELDAKGVAARFDELVVSPVRRLAAETIDLRAIAQGAVLPGVDASDRIAAAYRRRLFGDATLQDLPSDAQGPRFVINATNVQSGTLWRFMRPYMRDTRVGEVKNPTVPLAVAVAASSAFPPVLSPVVLELDPSTFTPRSGADLQVEPFTRRVVLTDGGVYDNLGLETAYKRFRTVLVSDAGGALEVEEKPGMDWIRHAVRTLFLIDNQVRSLRKRQLVAAFEADERRGAYWGVRTNIRDYQLEDALEVPFDKSLELAATPTRLKAVGDDLQERLINWGYAVTDAALRKHVDPGAARPRSLPYPPRPW
jgi:NTE family protein